MEDKLKEGIFYCKACGNLDYLKNGKCSKCESDNVEPADQEITFDSTAHDHLMKVIYAQHEYGYFDAK